MPRRRFLGNPGNGATLISAFGEPLELPGGTEISVVVMQRDRDIYDNNLMGRDVTTKIQFLESETDPPIRKTRVILSENPYFVTDVYGVGDGWREAVLSQTG